MKTKSTLSHRLATLLFATIGSSVAMGQDVKPTALATGATEPVQRAVCTETEDSITLSIGDRAFLRYHKSAVQPPAGIDSVFQRSGYIHPIQTPSGRKVTGDFAPDHPHQHGFFMAWVNTQFAGHDVDFWNQRKKTGKISHSKVIEVKSSDAFAQFEVELSHEDITQPAAPVLVLSERWKVRAAHRNAGQPFIFDFESRQTCVAETPLTLKEHHYGGFGLRGTQQWCKPDAHLALKAWAKETAKAKKDPAIELPAPPSVDKTGFGNLTSENKQRHDGNHTPARWTAVYGVVDEEMAGIAIMCHPDNFRSPQRVRLSPAKPYFSYAPIVDGEFKIQPQETYTTRFRVVSFDGEPDKETLDQLWNDYSTE